MCGLRSGPVREKKIESDTTRLPLPSAVSEDNCTAREKPSNVVVRPRCQRDDECETRFVACETRFPFRFNYACLLGHYVTQNKIVT